MSLEFKQDRERIQRGYEALNKIEKLTPIQRERKLKTWIRICRGIELFAKVVYFINDKLTTFSQVVYNCVLYTRNKVRYYEGLCYDAKWEGKK